VKLLGGPVQPFADDVTVIVLTIGVVRIFNAGNVGKLPVPVVSVNPKEGVAGLLHEKVAPETPLAEVNTVEGTDTPLQYTRLPTLATVGNGFTVIVKLTGVPAQLFAVGVIVMSPDIFVLLVLVVRKAGMVVPLPDAPNPIAVLLFVQVKVVPVELLPKVTNVEFVPEQIV
jgi:hypothetical protein